MTKKPRDITDSSKIIGYLNFSAGQPDFQFQKEVNELPLKWNTENLFKQLKTELQKMIKQLQSEAVPGFDDCSQASKVISLGLETVYPAYREYHQDLLGHVSNAEFANPLFLSRIFELTLSNRELWETPQELCSKVIDGLNDYIGYRPVAVLENDRQSEPYAHEYLAPIPLYRQQIGVMHGKYFELIEHTLQLFRETPADFLSHAHLSLDALEEISLDLRAFTCTNPAFKRTNYIFGEWDPDYIGIDGKYHRFVLRKVVIDALLTWIDNNKKDIGMEEALFDASASLCGTILMASSVSGSGPETHDSSVSLTNLMPSVAGYRDQFYIHLLTNAKGARAERLRKSEEQSRQPFGHVRQSLNQALAQTTSRQAQYRQLGVIFAQLGYSELSLIQVEKIPSPAFRFEAEIRSRIKSANTLLDSGELDEAIKHATQIDQLLFRGIECGAIVDPWNILGFQGLYPLFTNREDTIQDSRVEILLDMMHQIFLMEHRIIRECALQGMDEDTMKYTLSQFQKLAERWDRYATHVVEGLPQVPGMNYYNSAVEIQEILSQWSKLGKPQGNLAFWRDQQSRLTNQFSYAAIVDAVLKSGDHVVSIGLLMEWLSHAEEWSLETPLGSLNGLLIRWLKLVIEKMGSDQVHNQEFTDRLKKLFDFLEANAGPFWDAPSIKQHKTDHSEAKRYDPFSEQHEKNSDEEDDEDDLFSAAYENLSFKDSTDDGVQGSLADSGKYYELTEIERIQMKLEPHLRFLETVAKLWQFTGHILFLSPMVKEDDSAKQYHDVIATWVQHIRQVLSQLEQTLQDVRDYPLQDHPGERPDNFDFDVQNQTRLSLLSVLTYTHIQFQFSEWILASNLPEVSEESISKLPIISFLRHIKHQNLQALRSEFPKLIKQLKKLKLLYTPYEHGGEIEHVLGAQTRLAFLKLLLSELPHLGMYREAWQLLRTCFYMERSSRVRGPSITEFDRLFKETLQNTLKCLLQSAGRWKRGKFSDNELIEILDEVQEFYRELWKEHSLTMRLSPAESLLDKFVFKELESFVVEYGVDLFHPRQMSMPHIRSYLQRGIEEFLEEMQEKTEVFDPPKLVVDLQKNAIDQETATHCIEIIYSIIVDKFERFMEYSSTTTLSDYGDKLTCFLDFMRVEVEYERDEWMLSPIRMLHDVLVQEKRFEIANSLFLALEEETKHRTDTHLQNLHKVEKKYGVRLPGVTDYLSERFLKPLQTKQLTGLVKGVYEEAKLDKSDQTSIDKLLMMIKMFQETTQGSIVDLPEWLHELSHEVSRMESMESTLDSRDYLHPRNPVYVSLTEFRKQLRKWDEPLDGPVKKKPKKDSDS